MKERWYKGGGRLGLPFYIHGLVEREGQKDG